MASVQNSFDLLSSSASSVQGGEGGQKKKRNRNKNKHHAVASRLEVETEAEPAPLPASIPIKEEEEKQKAEEVDVTFHVTGRAPALVSRTQDGSFVEEIGDGVASRKSVGEEAQTEGVWQALGEDAGVTGGRKGEEWVDGQRKKGQGREEKFQALVGEPREGEQGGYREEAEGEGKERLESGIAAEGVGASSVEREGNVDLEVWKLEEAARTCSSDEGSRLQLWHEWTIRAHLEGEAATKWKEALRRSRALEMSVGSSLRTRDHRSSLKALESLLAAFLRNSETAQVMAQVTMDLAQSIGGGSPVDKNLESAAEIAVAAAITALKVGEKGWAMSRVAKKMADTTVQHELQRLNQESAEIEQQLQLSSNSADVSSNPDDRSMYFRNLVHVSEQRLAILLPDLEALAAEASLSSPQDPSSAPAIALQSIRKLTAEIVAKKSNASHKAEAASEKVAAAASRGKNEGGERGGEGGALAANGEPSADEALRSSVTRGGAGDAALDLHKELAVVTAEWERVQEQVVRAEAELSRLRDLKTDLGVKKEALLSRIQEGSSSQLASGASSSTSEPSQTHSHPSHKGKAGGVSATSASPEDVAMTCVRQLGVVHALEALLLRPPSSSASSSSPSGVSEAAFIDSTSDTVLSAVTQTVIDHLNALVALLAAYLEQLQGAGERLRFSSEKMLKLRAERQVHLDRGKAQLAEALTRPLEAVEGMYAKRRVEVEGIMAEADAVEFGLQRPVLRTAVAFLPPLPGIHLLLHQIGHTLNQVRIEFAAIMKGPGKEVVAAAQHPPPSSSSRSIRSAQSSHGPSSRPSQSSSASASFRPGSNAPSLNRGRISQQQKLAPGALHQKGSSNAQTRGRDAKSEVSKANGTGTTSSTSGALHIPVMPHVPAWGNAALHISGSNNKTYPMEMGQGMADTI